jgi:tRNA(Ile)-lysidine synthase
MLSFVQPSQVDRFRSDLERLAGPPRSRLGIALSGGTDSLALLLLAGAAYPGAVAAATVDHRLRPESGSEARSAAALCRSLGILHCVLDVEVARGGEGLQGEARRARYRALGGWAAERGIETLATAHHCDDQAETILMRLRRGSGLSGLAGVRPLRRLGDLALVRPLLGWSRAELAALVERSGLVPIEDPSNRDPRFDRVTIRRFLAVNPDFDPRRLARSAAALAEADEAIEWAADRAEAERCSRSGGEWRMDVAGLPRALRRRLLGRALAWVRSEHGLGDRSGGDLDGLLQTLESGGKGTLAGTVGTAHGPCWTIGPAPARRTS